MNEASNLSHRPIRSFVLRQGRITSGQRDALTRLWTKYGLESDEILDIPKVFLRSAPIILEIGFGNGESLIEMASKHPDCNYIGIEVYPPGIGHLLLMLEQKDLPNVKIYCSDAIDILQRCIGDNMLSGVNIYFPDPWPKRKHHKRRLVTPAFVKLIAKKLKKGGVFHVVTDWKDYADQIVTELNQSVLFTDASYDPKLERLLTERPQTKFERRSMLRHYTVWNLIFERI